MFRYYGIDYMKKYLSIFHDNEGGFNPSTGNQMFKDSNLYKRCLLTVKKFENYLLICQDDNKWNLYLKTKQGILELLIHCSFIHYKKLLDIVRLDKYHYSQDSLGKLGNTNPEYYLEKTKDDIICVAYNPLTKKKGM